LVIRKKKGEKA